MSDITRILGLQKHRSILGISEITAVAIVVLLIAVQGMFIGKHKIRLNAAAEPAPFGVIGP